METTPDAEPAPVPEQPQNWRVFVALSIGIAAALIYIFGVDIVGRVWARLIAGVVGLGLSIVVRGTLRWVIIATGLTIVAGQVILAIFIEDENLPVYEAAVLRTCYGVAFLASIVVRKPLVAVVARAGGLVTPESVERRAPLFSTFMAVTAGWAALYFGRAGVSWWLAANQGRSAVLVNVLIGIPVTIAAVLVTFGVVAWRANRLGVDPTGDRLRAAMEADEKK